MSGAVELEASAKVNLGLELLGRRSDGYHEIATVFQEIDLADRLTFDDAPTLQLDLRGLPAPAGEDNLVMRAARALAAATGVDRGARIGLEKRIPPRAGLGGGSSDAAATLRGLDRLWGTGLGAAGMLDLAAGLGSDVPFFLVGGTALGLGRGESVCPLPDLPPCAVLVVCPEEGLSTPEVYRRAGAALTGMRNCNIIRRFAQYYLTGQGVRELLRNDLQAAAAGMLPAIGALCRTLEQAGAQGVALSGSGSAVFGLFGGREEAERARARVGSARTHVGRFRRRREV